MTLGAEARLPEGTGVARRGLGRGPCPLKGGAALHPCVGLPVCAGRQQDADTEPGDAAEVETRDRLGNGREEETRWWSRSRRPKRREGGGSRGHSYGRQDARRPVRASDPGKQARL